MSDIDVVRQMRRDLQQRRQNLLEGFKKIPKEQFERQQGRVDECEVFLRELDAIIRKYGDEEQSAEERRAPAAKSVVTQIKSSRRRRMESAQ